MNAAYFCINTRLGHLAYSNNFYNADDYTNPSDQQRRVLAPPTAGRRPSVIQEE